MNFSFFRAGKSYVQGLDKLQNCGYNTCRNLDGLVAQLGAHHIRIVGVESSNLFKSTKKNDKFLPKLVVFQ